jgi:hypothetical protein
LALETFAHPGSYSIPLPSPPTPYPKLMTPRTRLSIIGSEAKMGKGPPPPPP